MCLTDYSTSIEREGAPRELFSGFWGGHRPVSTGWVITIVAHHRLGSCRSPRDWTWSAIVGQTRPNFKLEDVREYRGYRPGLIRDQWLASEIGKDWRNDMGGHCC